VHGKDIDMQRRPRQSDTASIRRVLAVVIALTLGVWGLAAAALGGFGPPSNVVAEVSPELHKYSLQRIGIIAFVNRSTTPDAGMRLAHFFHAELESHRRFQVMPPLALDEETELEFRRTAQAAPEEERPGRLRQFMQTWLSRLWPVSPPPSEAPRERPPAEPAGQAGPPLDAVLTGVITRYEDRQGSALLVDQPASVAYEAYLFSARDGEILWRARFDETQRPLLDNLLLIDRFLKGGGVWQTNDTLARIGLERVVKTFPGIAGAVAP
jgi:hypothetical protein